MTIQKSSIPARKTRALIQQSLKQDGPLSATQLGRELGVTAMAIRQHLYDMENEGLIATRAEKNGKGRPTKQWFLTDKANHLFTDSHASLTVELIGAVRTTFGEDGLARIISERTSNQIHQYENAMKNASDLESRLMVLAEKRTSEGYMAAVANDGEGGYLFIENHCPVCQAATVCTGLCASELDVFRSVLGVGVAVERQDHILMGARRCVYSVRSISS